MAIFSILIFYQDYRKYIAIIGFFILVYGFINFPLILATKFHSRSFTKFFVIYLFLTVSIVGLTIFSWFKYQNIRLHKYGQNTKAIVIEKYMSRGSYQITYSFKFKNEIINSRVSNNELNIGDTIIIKFMPDNPYNNEIIKND